MRLIDRAQMNDELRALWATLPEHKVRFELAKGRYAELRDGLRTKSQRETWTMAPAFALEPFGVERTSGRSPGRILKSRPGILGTKACCHRSFDEHVVCEQRFNGDGTYYEEFVDRSPRLIRTTLFDYYSDKNVVNVQSLVVVDQLPTSFVRYAIHGVMAESYVYNDGQLVEAFTASQEHAGPRNTLMLTRDTFTYDDAGRMLVAVTREWDGGERERIYPRARG